MNLNEYINHFKSNEPRYIQLKDEIVKLLDEVLKELDVKIIDITSRIKEEESLRFKIKDRQYKDPIKQVTDYAGVRIVCGYESDFDLIEGKIKSHFKILDSEDKTEELGVDRMGYQGRHYVVSLRERISNNLHDDLKDICCEIQLRTILQNSWSIASHNLLYKKESLAPKHIRRDLNNVASLLEIAQQIFDRIKATRNKYIEDIKSISFEEDKFLSQEINFESLTEYTNKKYPNLKPSIKWQNRLLADLNKRKYKTLQDIDDAVEKTKNAVEAYKQENPSWFKTGTGHITKALGFIDAEFRKTHPFGGKTIVAFDKYKNLVNS